MKKNAKISTDQTKKEEEKKCHNVFVELISCVIYIPIMSDRPFKMKRLGEVKDLLKDLRATSHERGEIEEIERKEKFVRHVLGVPGTSPKPIPKQIPMEVDLTIDSPEASLDSSEAAAVLPTTEDSHAPFSSDESSAEVDLRYLQILENNVLGHDALKDIMKDQLRLSNKGDCSCQLDDKQLSNAVRSLLQTTNCDPDGDKSVAAYFVINFLGPACLQRQDFPTELSELIPIHESLVADKILRPLMLLQGDPCPPDKFYSSLSKIQSPDLVQTLAKSFFQERTIREEDNQFLFLEMFIEHESLFGDPEAVSELCKCLMRSGSHLSKSSKFAKCLASVLRKIDISAGLNAMGKESLDNLRKAAVDNATFVAKSVIKDLDKKRKS